MTTFIHIPKNAGTTINWMLRNTYGVTHCDAEPIQKKFTVSDLRLTKRLYPNLQSIGGHNIYPYTDFTSSEENFRYFTMLREPVSRIISFYIFKKRTGDAIKLENIVKWSNQMTRHLAGVADFSLAKDIIEKKNIFCGTVENFNESIFLLKTLRIPELNISFPKKQNVSPRSLEYTDLLNDINLKEKILENNVEDVKLYRYVSEELLATYRSMYGANLPRNFAEKTNERVNQINIIKNRIYRNLVYKPMLSIARRLYRL